MFSSSRKTHRLARVLPRTSPVPIHANHTLSHDAAFIFSCVFRQHGVDNDTKADRGEHRCSTRSQLFSETEVVYSIIYSLNMEISQRLFDTTVLWIIVSAGIKGHRGYAVILLYSDLVPPVRFLHAVAGHATVGAYYDSNIMRPWVL